MHHCKEFLFICFWIMDICIKSSWFNMLFKASVSLLIFSLDSLFIDVSGVLDFFVLLCYYQFPCFVCVCVCVCVNICFMSLGAHMLAIYMYLYLLYPLA